MKNHKTLIIFAVLLVLAYFDDPDMFSLQEEDQLNNAYSQLSYNGNQGQNQFQPTAWNRAAMYSNGNQRINPTIASSRPMSYASSNSANKRSYGSNNASNSGQTMTIVKCVQQGDNILAAAFMLPPKWQNQCHTQYKMQGKTMSADSLYQAQSPNKNIRLFNEPSYIFYYDAKMLAQLKGTMNIPGMDPGMMQASGYNSYMQKQTQLFNQMYPPAVDLVQFAQQNLPNLMRKEGYKVYHISKDPIAQSLQSVFSKELKAFPAFSDVEVNSITAIAQSQNKPNEIKMMKTIQVIMYMGSRDKYSWTLMSFNASGDKQHSNEMSKLINMVIETRQDNPRFTQMLAQVNSKMLRQNIKDIARTSEIRRQTNNEISAMINKAYKDRQASSDRIQSKWVDANWEVENYRDPFSGQQVKLPSSNKYYFSNNLDDYLGTNNPLVDPNVDLNYLYNWQKLERL